jgi:hypothetical protein
MNRLLLSDDAGHSVPIAMYDNWVFAGGTWRPENPGYIAGDTDDDENNDWLDIDDKHNRGYVCRVFTTTTLTANGSRSLVFMLPKFARKNGSTRSSGTGDLAYGGTKTMVCGEINWKRV